ncbi:MAG: hypothetical protein ACI8UO_006495, partial [Verrucomicrobiales bacterium]
RLPRGSLEPGSGQTARNLRQFLREVFHTVASGSYPTVLAVSEYETSELERVQVAHYVLYDRIPQSYPDKIGTFFELQIAPATAIKDFKTYQIIDKLDFDPDAIEQWVDVSQKLIRKPLGNFPSLVAQDKVSLFWQKRGVIKTVILGDSRSDQGVLPSLLGTSNPTFNFAMGGSRYETTLIVFENYLPEAPELEVIIVGLSPRYFEMGSLDGHGARWREAPSILPLTSDGAVDIPSPGLATLAIYNPWGELHSNANASTKPVFDLSWRLKVKRALSNSTHFRIDQAKLDALERMIDTCKRRGIRLYGFTPPAHPITSETIAANDGIGRATYSDLVRRLELLADGSDGVFHIRDIDQAGSSGYPESHFMDLDHLNPDGAKRLTNELRDWIDEVTTALGGD